MCSRSFLTTFGRMQSSPHGLKFCGARVACLVLAHAATHVTFHRFF